MTDKEKIELLQKWQDNYNDINIVMNNFQQAIGCICESDIYNACWKTFDSYTDTLANVLNNDINNQSQTLDWLNWYAYDNDMGKNGMEAKASTWNKMKKISNLKMLLKVISE